MDYKKIRHEEYLKLKKQEEKESMYKINMMMADGSRFKVYVNATSKEHAIQRAEELRNKKTMAVDPKEVEKRTGRN